MGNMKHICRRGWLWLLCLWLGAAQAAASLEQITAGLRQRLQPVAEDSGHSRELTEVESFYAQRDYQPAWVTEAGFSPQAHALLAALARAEDEGLRPEDYDLAKLESVLDKARAGEFPVAQWVEWELLLTRTFFAYGGHLSSGRFKPQDLNPNLGITPSHRDLTAILNSALAEQEIAAAFASLAPSHPGYLRLRTALANYRKLEQAGGWPVISAAGKLAQGMRHAQLKRLRARLAVTGDLEPVADTGGHSLAPDEELFDDAVFQAVRRFQRRHGLPEDGVVGSATLLAMNVPVSERVRQLEINMERWRWLPEDLGRRHILINITDYRLNVVEDGGTVLEASVVVGKSSRPTPVYSGMISYLVFSPYWHVPRTIATKDKLPQLRKNPAALARQNIRVYDPRAGGREINPGRVNWRAINPNNFPYQLRQDPGPRNALGGIKFMFPNPYDVYLHDTPSTHLFNRVQRAFSSGCVRVSKPVELAEYLLKDNPRWSRKAIVSASRGKREQTVTLADQVPVHLLYWTAWAEEDNTVHFRDDIYEYDKSIAKALHGDKVVSKKEPSLAEGG